MANTLPAHPHVVMYYRVWQDARIMYVQMELCERGTLRDQMGRDGTGLVQERQLTWQLVTQLGSALNHIHGHNMLHCDIKPDNVMIDSAGDYKLGDLGQESGPRRSMSPVISPQSQSLPAPHHHHRYHHHHAK